MARIFFEDFETDGNGSRYQTSLPEFSDGAGDFVTRTDGGNIGGFYEVTGQSGDSWFAIMDTDGEPPNASVVSLEFNDINISGQSDLMFSGLFAEDDDGANQDWDADALVYVEVSIDGGPYVKVLQFASQGATNTEPGLDTDFDGVADSTMLGSAFARFSAAIAGTGSLLDMRITAENLDAGDEDISFDAIEVTGTGGATEVVALDERFDDAGGFTVSSGFFSDGAGDYLGLTGGAADDFGAGATPSAVKDYGDADGGYLTGMDLDGEGADLPVTIEWAGIDIDGLRGLRFSGDFAEFFDAPGDIDEGDFLRVVVSIDGGPDQTVLAFEGADLVENDGINGFFYQDTDLDGTGDGAALGTDFQTFMADIAGQGSSMDLRLITSVNAGDEDFAVDNFRIVGESGGSPTPAVVVAAGDGVAVAEGGAGDSFTLALATEPEAPVTITIAAEDRETLVSADGVTFGGTAEVVLSDTGSVEVFVSAVDDSDDEADPHSGTLTFTVQSADAAYDGLQVNDLGLTIADDDTEITLISDIQGSGDATELAGMQATVAAVVTGIITDGDGNVSGYFLQEEDADQDGDAATSEGLFVFAPDAEVSVGDLLQVTGTVGEFRGMTQLSSVTDTTTLSSGNTLPTVTQITLSDIGDYENVEAMRVELVSNGDDPLTVITNFNLDRFGEIEVAEGNQTQPTQILDPDTQAEEIDALREANETQRLTIDDFSTEQNPDIYKLIDSGDGTPLEAGDPITADGPTLRLGSEISPVTGVMDERFGGYRLQTETPLEVTGGNPREQEAPDVGGTLQVASFNVLNYFTTLSGGTGPDGTVDVRGATTEADLERQTDKLVNALLEIDADIVGLQEVENNGFGEDSAIAALVDALNAATAPGTYAYVDPGSDFVGTDAITNGLIYKTENVTLNGSAVKVFEEASAATTFERADAIQEELRALGIYNDEDGNPDNDSPVGDFQRNRPAVAATFEDADGNEVTVAVNHFKSKGSSGLEQLIEDAQANGIDAALIEALLADPNYDQGDGQAFWNQVRADASGEVTDWLDSNPTAAGDTGNQLILGDLNAYAKEDPVQEFVEDGYTDLAQEFIGEDAYSFVFDGQRGTLDYGLASDEIRDKITGVAEWHIAADEPDLLSYDSEFSNADFYNDDPFAASDHDPLIIGLDLGGDPDTVVARLDFEDRFFGDRLIYSLDGEEQSNTRLRLLQSQIEAEDAGITIDARDGLWGPEYLSTAGKGLGIFSIFGDRWIGEEKRLLEDREVLSFDLDETEEAGDALAVGFEFKRAIGPGEIVLTFYDDGAQVEQVVLELDGNGVSHDLEGDAQFDRVDLSVKGDLSLSLGAVEFERLTADEFILA